MKHKKYQLAFYSIRDFQAITAHLETMAEKGWMLEAITPYFWVYQRISPRKIPFTATFFPNTCKKDYIPSEEQIDFQAYCEDAGWKFVAQLSRLLIFAGNTEHPVQIDTDDAVTLKTIHQIMGEKRLTFIVLSIVIALYAGLITYATKTKLALFLSSVSHLLSVSILPLLLLTYIAETSTYYVWYRNAKKAVHEKTPLPAYPIISLLIRNLIKGIILLMSPIILLGLSQRDHYSMLLFVILLTTFQYSTEKKHISGQTNKKEKRNYAILNGLCTALFIGIARISSSIGFIPEQFQEVPSTILPLTGEQLYHDQFLKSSHLYKQSSMFLTYYQVAQQRTDQDLVYDAVELHMPSLREFVVRDLLSCTAGFTCDYQELDPVQWQAERVYQSQSVYVIVSANRIMKLHLPASLNKQQLQLIGDALHKPDWFHE